MAFPTAAQAGIDEEIGKLMTRIYSLLTQRNMLSFTGRLPAETLATIFICCASDHHSEYNGRLTQFPSWVNVSYVCRFWRDVALGCPTLWSHIFIISPRWTEVLLVRSKQVPLKICMKMYGACHGEYEALHFVGQVANHMERVQELRLRLSSTSLAELFSILSSRAPRLQNLEIEMGYNETWDWILFNGDTPALSALRLRSCPVRWYSFKLNGLTSLHLQSLPIQCQQNMDEFLATLRCMQGLRHLYLVDALGSATGFLSTVRFSTFQKVNLPHLSRLLLVAPLLGIIALFFCVDFPSKTEFRLECSGDCSTDLADPYCPSLRYSASLPSQLAQRLDRSTGFTPSSSTIRSLAIESPILGPAKFSFSATEHDPDSYCDILQEEWGCNIPLRLTFNPCRHVSWDDEVRVTRDFFRPMLSTHIRNVHVIKPLSSPDFWQKAFGHFKGLRRIKLSKGNMPDLASLLDITEKTEDQGGGNTDRPRGSDKIFAPALEELVLHDIRLSSDPRGYPYAANIQSLYDALSSRQKPGGQLTMTECYLFSDHTHNKRVDLVGKWGGGRFHIVESD